MKLQDHQHLVITPLSEMPGFERTLVPKNSAHGWTHQIWDVAPIAMPMELSARHQHILDQSRHIQAQLQQLTQGLFL